MMRPITKEVCVNEDKSPLRGQSSSDNQSDSPYRYQSTNSGKSRYVC